MPVVMDDVRKLATLEEVAALTPIEGADAIEAATVRGWTVVVKKGDFSVGDRVLYFEEDTALPVEDERFAFLASRGTREDDGREYHVLKIAKLRGVYSQGLILPLEQFTQELQDHFPGFESGHLPTTGTDLTQILGLGKWEVPIPVGNGQIAGAFLTAYARKTDSERVQNLGQVWEAIRGHEWEASEKIDGTSCTVVRDSEGNLRVMGRNWEITEGDNTYWNVLGRFPQLAEALEPGDVVQFEIAGPSIQKNRLGLKDLRPFVFDFVRSGRVLPRSEWPTEVLKLATPLVNFELPETPEELVTAVDGMKSLVTPGRYTEGVVFHTVNGELVPEVGDRNTFKVISNKFLTKG